MLQRCRDWRNRRCWLTATIIRRRTWATCSSCSWAATQAPVTRPSCRRRVCPIISKPRPRRGPPSRASRSTTTWPTWRRSRGKLLTCLSYILRHPRTHERARVWLLLFSRLAALLFFFQESVCAGQIYCKRIMPSAIAVYLWGWKSCTKFPGLQHELFGLMLDVSRNAQSFLRKCYTRRT